jgi:hypothetical protein
MGAGIPSVAVDDFLVECELKQFRTPGTRFTKRAAYYRTELTLAAIILWLRDSPDTP